MSQPDFNDHHKPVTSFLIMDKWDKNEWRAFLFHFFHCEWNESCKLDELPFHSYDRLHWDLDIFWWIPTILPLISSSLQPKNNLHRWHVTQTWDEEVALHFDMSCCTVVFGWASKHWVSFPISFQSELWTMCNDWLWCTFLCFCFLKDIISYKQYKKRSTGQIQKTV